MGGTAAVVSAIGAVVGGGAAVYSAHQAAKDREDEEKRMKKQGEREAAIHKDKTRRLIGAQKAAYAAGGVSTDIGTPLEVIRDTRRQAEKEREDILKGYGVRGDALSKEASRLRTSGYADLTGSLLTGVSRYAASPYARNPFETRR